MRVGLRVDQLHVHAHLLPGLLNVAFQNVRHSKLLRDLGEVPRVALILPSRGPGDHLQRADLREPGQDFILDAVRISVVAKKESCRLPPRQSVRTGQV